MALSDGLIDGIIERTDAVQDRRGNKYRVVAAARVSETSRTTKVRCQRSHQLSRSWQYIHVKETKYTYLRRQPSRLVNLK